MSNYKNNSTMTDTLKEQRPLVTLAKRIKTGMIQPMAFMILFFIPCSLLMNSCGAKKAAVSNQQPMVNEPEVPSWHTCLIQGARIMVETDEDKLSATANMHIVRDSMLVISIMPMLGIEMLRIEATPEQVIGIDKIHAQYAMAGFDELSNTLSPAVTWTELQQLCSAELPNGSERAVLQYRYGGEQLRLTIDYPERQTDVPVRVFNLRLDKYKQVDVSRWL
jgi:hypothetical protein